MGNPTPDYPTAIHSATDVSAFAASKLGSTNPTHTALEGKQEAEVVAVQTKIGTGASTPTTGKILKGSGTGTSAWGDLTQDEVGDGSTYKQYSSTEKSKLGAIEALADVTDAGNVGSSIHGSTPKTTMADTDKVAIIDTEASNVLKTLSWTYVKSILKTYFDSIYSLLTLEQVQDDLGGTSGGDGFLKTADGHLAIAYDDATPKLTLTVIPNVCYPPTGVEFGSASQEYDITGNTWVTASAGGTLGGIPDAGSAGHTLVNCLTAISISRDGAYLNVRELTGAASATNPLTVQFLFTGVTAFDTIESRSYYIGSASHNMDIQLWNWTTSAFDTYSSFAGESGYQARNIQVFSPSLYIGTGGNIGKVILQFIHTSSGLATHGIQFDYVAICDGGGGSGGASIASAVAYTPTGTIAATNVQTAINELDTEKLSKATYDAHSILYATTDDTPVALTVTEQTVVGRATGGNIVAIAIDSDLSSVSASDDTIPSSKATKAMGDLKLPLAGGTMTGALNLGENASIELDSALSAHSTYSGIFEAGVLGATITFGQLCYFQASDSRWELVDSDLSAGYDKKLGICLQAGNDGDVTKILLYGKVRSLNDDYPTFTIGSPVYMSETAGGLVVAQPTTTNTCIRIIGFGNTADELFFNPSNDYIVHI